MTRAVHQMAVLATGLCAGCVILSAAVADEYSWQVSASYYDDDAANAVQANHRLVRATYYSSAVDDRVGPYELAPFLNRSSYVAAGAGRTRVREEAFPALSIYATAIGGIPPDAAIDFIGSGSAVSLFPAESGIDSSEYAVDGRYVWPGSGWYAGAHAQRSDGDLLPQLPFLQLTAEFRTTGLFAGRYFGPRTAVELGLGSEEISQEQRTDLFANDPVFGLPGLGDVRGFYGAASFGSRSDTETDNARLSVKHVGDLGDSVFALSASVRSSRADTWVSVTFPPDLVLPANPFDPPGSVPVRLVPAVSPIHAGSEREREISLSGALFPVASLGVRLTVSTSDHDTRGTSDLIGLSATWFFVRNAAVEIGLTRTSSAHGYFPGSTDTDSVGVQLLGRF